MKFNLACVSLLIAVALAFASGCRKQEPSDLVVVSPHADQIQQEFGRAFSAWHQEKYGSPAAIQWRDMGGTSSITKTLMGIYDAGAATSQIDVYFGGGAPDHKALGVKGHLQPIELPAETLANIPQFIDGVQQYDTVNGWYGACVSSFGILYNAAQINRINGELPEARKLPTPTTWDDLADPRMFGRTIAAGPKSGSAKASYEMMLQAAGEWPNGWPRLLEFWANCQAFTQGSSEVPMKVRNGQALAATSIDFYAFKEIALAPPGELKFVLPADGVVFTPDPISVLKGAPNAEMARRFVEFVLSPQGQALWCLPAGTPGGPQEYTLFRQPIRKDVYDKYAGQMPEQIVNIFEKTGRLTLNSEVQEARVAHILPRLMQAAAIDNDQLLREAWKACIDAGMPADMMAEFGSLPENLATQEALLATAAMLAEADDVKAEAVVSAWHTFFREKYRKLAGK